MNLLKTLISHVDTLLQVLRKSSGLRLIAGFCEVAELLVRIVKVEHLLNFQDEYLKSNDSPS
jgi:hypothetical protein